MTAVTNDARKSRSGKVSVVGAGFYGSTTALRLATNKVEQEYLRDRLKQLVAQ